MDYQAQAFRLLGLPVLASAIGIIGYLLINEWTRYQARLKGLPGPQGLPLIGNLHQVPNHPCRILPRIETPR
jgi:hypothetical protein